MEEGKGVKAGGDSAGQPVSVRVLPPSSVTSTTQFTFFLLKNGERKNKQDDQSLNDSVKFLDHCSPRFLQSRDSFAAQGTRMAMG
jgi:hypothetical protein